MKEFCIQSEALQAYNELKTYIENLEHQNNLNEK